MAIYKIKRYDCIKCGECAILCHVDAIIEDEVSYYIDIDKCVGCGACIAVCPVQAIYEYKNKYDY